MNSKRIIYFTKYTEAGPSSRYRSYQYKKYLENNGFEIVINPLFPSKYIADLYGKGKKNIWILIPQYIKRFFQVLFLKNYDILFIEYELFPYIPFFFEKIALLNKKNIVLDYDDATFHTYDKSGSKLIKVLCGSKIYQLVQLSSLTITGSPYLSKVLSKYSANVVEIPTSISFKKYQNTKSLTSTNDVFIIGWVGSKNTSVNVLPLKSVFIQLQQKYNIKLHLIGFDKKLLPLLEGVHYESIVWEASTEVETISKFDVGIMPLENNFFNQGKCGFKLIQYMACGIPTISTPLEANIKINRNNGNLFATSTEEWFVAFENVINNKDWFKLNVGEKNRQIVENEYCIESNYNKYVVGFNDLVKSGLNE
jgi:glycosyltransferase involved in cell wall biosynthesis